MTEDELCGLLNGRQYKEEINAEIERKVREHNLHWTYSQLVIVFGGSDDLMEFRGAIEDEVGCYDGGKAYLTINGLLENHCDDEECPYFADKKKRAMTIEALWCAEKDIPWTYKTDIPHSTFEIVDDGEIYCRGIVFNLADVKEKE